MQIALPDFILLSKIDFFISGVMLLTGMRTYKTKKRRHHDHPIIGLDFGGVICDNQKHPNKHRDITLISEIFDYCESAKPMQNAMEAIRELIDLCGSRNVWIISRASENGGLVILWWLHHYNFYKQTGFLENRILFCREREDKAKIANEIGLTAMIDDRYSVLRHFYPQTTTILFNPTQEEKDLVNQNKVNLPTFQNWGQFQRIKKALLLGFK